MHSTASDGALAPQELLRYAMQHGVTHMALTDHDTFDGSDVLLAERHLPISVLCGIELSMRHPSLHGLHLLGYSLADQRRQAPLRLKVRQLAEARDSRGEQIVRNLNRLGFPLDWDALRQSVNGVIGRPHIADALVAAGHAVSKQDAFKRLIGEDCPAYVDGEKLSMREAIPLMLASGFVPVLAHPRLQQLEDSLLRRFLGVWKEYGLQGVEVYHPSGKNQTGYEVLDRMARSMGFLVTGGSDFHRKQDDRHGEPGSTVPCWYRAEEDYERLIAALHAAART